MSIKLRNIMKTFNRAFKEIFALIGKGFEAEKENVYLRRKQ